VVVTGSSSVSTPEYLKSIQTEVDVDNNAGTRRVST
jgi:hypothetical protein